MNQNETNAAAGAPLSDAEFGGHNPLIPAFNVLRKDAERYRWCLENPIEALDIIGRHRQGEKRWTDVMIDERMNPTPNFEGEARPK